MKTVERSHIDARKVGSVQMTADDCADYLALESLGINFPRKQVAAMAKYAMDAMAMDDQQGGITTASINTPVQFLQNWLPGFVNTITAARKIDDFCGISSSGAWEDEECVQGVLEPIGNAVPYGDYSNVPFSSFNTNFERRTIVRFEKGFKVGALEEARTARIRINAAAEKRGAAALALEIQRNAVGFYGYNSGANRTYGFLNDPALSAYGSVPAGVSTFTTWSKKTFGEINADIRTAAAALQSGSQDTINPEDMEITLAVPTNSYQYLSVTSDFGVSVRDWISKTYPKMRIISAPQLNQSNGGANVFYMYAERVEDGASDDSRVWIQVVPAKFQSLGVEKQSKAYVEDYANATAGVMLKRPYAVVRYSGI
jgi:hypothetical protein